MDRSASSHLERAWTTAMLLRLWLADVVFAARWWALRAAEAAIGVSRHPFSLATSLALVTAIFVTSEIKVGLHDPPERFAGLDLRAISGAAELFAHDTGSAPARLEELVPRYLKELHRDPWGSNYVLFQGPGGLAVASAGPDGVLGTSDDLLRVVSPDLGYVLPASDHPALLQPGDIVRAINGRPIRSAGDFLSAIAVPPPVDVELTRPGRPFCHYTVRALTTEALRFVKNEAFQ